MVSGNQLPSGAAQVAESLGKMLGFPSPEKFLGELQRLNNNLELLQPDIHKLAAFFDGGGRTDIQNLTAALNKVDMGNVMRILNDFNSTVKSLYDKLWSR